MKNIISIFTSEDKNDLKAGIKKIILEHFKNELESFDEYFFDKSILDEIIQGAFEEIIKELKPELKAIVRQKMLNSIDLEMLKKIM